MRMANVCRLRERRVLLPHRYPTGRCSRFQAGLRCKGQRPLGTGAKSLKPDLK